MYFALERKDNYSNYAKDEIETDCRDALYKSAEYEYNMFSQLFDYIEDTEKKLDSFNTSKENEEGLEPRKVLKVLMFDRLQTKPEDYAAVINKCLIDPYAVAECNMTSTLNLKSYNSTDTICKYNVRLHDTNRDREDLIFIFADKMYNLVTPNDDVLCVTKEDYEKGKTEYAKVWTIEEYFPEAYQFILSV
jgi:hypothetical protein